MLKCFCVIKNRAIIVQSSYVKWSWKLERLHEQQYPMCGHHACNVWTDTQDVRGVGHLQACLELRSDSGIYWSCPETLWSVLIGAWAYKTPSCPLEGLTQPNMGNSPLPGEGPHRVWALLLLPTPEPGLTGQEAAVGPAGEGKFPVSYSRNCLKW